MIIEDRRMSREAGPKFREVRRPAKQRPETKEHIREEGGESEGSAQEREVERWAVKDGMDDLGAREQFPSGPEVYTMYPPDTPGQPHVVLPGPRALVAPRAQAPHGPQQYGHDWVSFIELGRILRNVISV